MTLTDKALRRIHRYTQSRKQAFEDQIPGGKADEASPLDFSREQLVKGVVVEYEHTTDFLKALEIAMDHLTENPKYYDYLEDMESKFSEIAATYYGDKDPYEKEVVDRQDDWMRVDPGETNVENWKHMENGKVTDYKRKK